MKKSDYINLKINGRLFPSWIITNFKKYKLPELSHGTDPCNESIKSELRKYQQFITSYLDYNSIYHDVLLYHGLGAGKTATIINMYNVLYSYDPMWNVFILVRASLHNAPWLIELEKWLEKNNYEDRMKNIHFVHYDSPNADKSFIEEIKKSDSDKTNIFIIDEVHNFIKNVYSNISSRQGKKAQIIYDMIIKEKQSNPNTRVVCISATPAINYPFELALLFNMLRPGSFPTSEAQFNSIFVQSGNFPTINNATKNIFQRRIMGLVSYYIGATPEYFASQMTHVIDVEMSDYQCGIYEYYDEIEKKIAKKSMGRTEMSRIYTRQVCNFVFPHIDQNINGEQRPRPNKFKISEEESKRIDEGKNVADKSKYMLKYTETLNTFVSYFRKYCDKINLDDITKKYTIKDDIKIFVEKHKGDYDLFKKEKHSDLYNELFKCSHKMLRIALNIMLSMGPVLVYSNYVIMEGLEIFKIYLEYFGFKHKNNTDVKFYNYLEYSGNIDQKERAQVVKTFEDIKNMHGELAKVLLISQAGSEGISLYNMRQVHIMEPYWHETRTDQMVGRAIRFCSHKNLPKNERVVDVFKYKSVFTTNKKETSDEYVYNYAKSKSNLIRSFLEPIKEVAVDCELFKEHNKISGNYKCFQFNELSLFDQNVGPAFKPDFKDDLKMDNGLNSINSTIMKIKVLKIKGMMLLNNNIDNPKYSDEKDYWYNHDTKIVYDSEFHYPIGKVAVVDNVPIKTENNVYIIDKIVPIPILIEK